MMRFQKLLAWFLILSLGWLSAGCIEIINFFGMETHVTEQSRLSKDNKPEDDRIEDKNPVYDPERTIVEKFENFEVTLNKSATVTKLDVVPFESGLEEELFDNILFPGRSQALAALNQLPWADVIPSMEVVNGFMRPFNGGLYAAIETDLQNGQTSLGLQSKRILLQDLLTALQVRWENATGQKKNYLQDALVYIAAALLAGGNSVELPNDLLSLTQTRVNGFLNDPLFSHPIGFYTWSTDLEEVFKQDRLLHNHQSGASLEEFGQFAVLALVLGEEEELLQRYQQILDKR